MPEVSIKPAPTFYVKEIVIVSSPTPGSDPQMAYGDEVGGCSYFTRVTLIKDPSPNPVNLEDLQAQMKNTLSKEQG